MTVRHGGDSSEPAARAPCCNPSRAARLAVRHISRNMLRAAFEDIVISSRTGGGPSLVAVEAPDEKLSGERLAGIARKHYRCRQPDRLRPTAIRAAVGLPDVEILAL